MTNDTLSISCCTCTHMHKYVLNVPSLCLEVFTPTITFKIMILSSSQKRKTFNHNDVVLIAIVTSFLCT